jgi:hypothetical protein
MPQVVVAPVDCAGESLLLYCTAAGIQYNFFVTNVDKFCTTCKKGRWLELETLWARFARLLAALALIGLASLARFARLLAALEPEPQANRPTE